MTKLPKKLKICGSIWHIKLSSSILKTDNAVGLCDYKNKTIFIYPDKDKKELGSTFIHEILHTIFPTGLVGDKKEELIVDLLADRLYDILKSNKIKLRYKR